MWSGSRPDTQVDGALICSECGDIKSGHPLQQPGKLEQADSTASSALPEWEVFGAGTGNRTRVFSLEVRNAPGARSSAYLNTEIEDLNISMFKSSPGSVVDAIAASVGLARPLVVHEELSAVPAPES